MSALKWAFCETIGSHGEYLSILDTKWPDAPRYSLIYPTVSAGTRSCEVEAPLCGPRWRVFDP